MVQSSVQLVELMLIARPKTQHCWVPPFCACKASPFRYADCATSQVVMLFKVLMTLHTALLWHRLVLTLESCKKCDMLAAVATWRLHPLRQPGSCA